MHIISILFFISVNVNWPLTQILRVFGRSVQFCSKITIFPFVKKKGSWSGTSVTLKIYMLLFQGKASSLWSQWTWAVSKRAGRGIAFGDEVVRRQQALLQSGHYLAGRRLARPLVGHCQSGSHRRPGEPRAINQIDQAAAKLYTHTHALAHCTLLSLSRLSLCQL